MGTVRKAESSGCENSKPLFEEVYDQYYFTVFRYLSAHMRNRQDAEDLTGDIFLYCYAHFAEYDPDKSRIGTWIYLVMNSRLKNYYRDRQEWVDIDEVEEFLSFEGEEMDRAVYLEQLRKELVSTLRQLPEKHQRAVVLRFLKDWDYDKIARELGTTAGNIRVIISRALKRIQENSSQLKEFLEVKGEV